jgi:hypothetical protein
MDGVVMCGGRCTLPAAASMSASSLCSRPSSRISAPAATGFMPQARWPDCTSLCRIAADTRVLPISVSVPVTKQAKRDGMPSAASAAGIGSGDGAVVVWGASAVVPGAGAPAGSEGSLKLI